MPPEIQSCPRCHGLDGGLCWKCGGTGSCVAGGEFLYPNTPRGRGRAAYARLVLLGKEPRKRTDYAREYMRARRAKQKEAK